MSAALEAYSLSPTFACSPLRVGNLRRELSWQIQPIPTSTRLLGVRGPHHIPSYDNLPGSIQLSSFERKRKSDAEILLFPLLFVLICGIVGDSRVFDGNALFCSNLDLDLLNDLESIGTMRYQYARWILPVLVFFNSFPTPANLNLPAQT